MIRFFVNSILFILVASYPNESRVLKENINVLTLYKDRYTTARRTSPVPQINCIGGTARSNSHKVEIVQCTNMGFDGTDYNWKCDSQLPDTLKLGKLRVGCEGYDYKGDPFVLAGSCSLDYELDYTDKFYEPKTIPTQTVIETIKTYESVSQSPSVRVETIHHAGAKPVIIEQHGHVESDIGTFFVLILLVFLFIFMCAITHESSSSTTRSTSTVIRTTPTVITTPVIVRESPAVVVRESYPSNTVIQRTVYTDSTPSKDSKNMHTSTSYGTSNDR